eukprot:scaffold67875_cov53-Attheya_sp.AAC.1
MHDHRLESSSDSKKNFKQLHPVRIRLILNASSVDGKTPAKAPTKDLASFYECKTVGAAKIHLEHSLTAVHGCILNLSTGFVTALYCGSFVWDSTGRPNNWTGFQFAKPAPDTPSGVQEAMILNLKATEGKGRSDNDIAKALVQGLVVASSVTDLQHNIHNEHSTAVYFFGKDSFLAKQLAVSRDHVRDNLQVYEALQAKDSSFVAKVIFSYSVRTDNWFRQCLKEQDRSKVDDSLLDFPEDHRAILNRRFDITLPVCLHPFKAAADTPRKSNSQTDQDQHPNKRPKQGSASIAPELG